jgi:hypothetical protein
MPPAQGKQTPTNVLTRGEKDLKKLMMLALAALMVALMVAMAAPALAVATCSAGPVTANDQAQGCFNTALGTANDASNRNADYGLRTAFMHNTQP